MPRFLFFFFLIPFGLSAQSSQLFEAYRQNVVSIQAHFLSGLDEEGFGFIVGEQDGFLLIATAGHVVHDEGAEPGLENPQSANIRFFDKKEDYNIERILYSSTSPHDFGLIEVKKPHNFTWRPDCLGSSHEDGDFVSYIGKGGKWFYPMSSTHGQINKINLDKIDIDIYGLTRGSSGAPLLGKDGIIGLIVSAQTANAEAIPMEWLQQEVTRSKTYSARYQLTKSPFIINLRTSDLNAWKNAKKEGGIQSYYDYLSEHPNGVYKSLARDSIQAISKRSEAKRKYEQSILEEQQDWEIVIELNKAEEFQRFIEIHPKSKRTPEAKRKLAALLPSPDIKENEMVLIEGGSFEMGYKISRDGSAEIDSLIPHLVNVSSFYLCRHEVTFKQFKAFVEATNYVTSAEKNNFSYIWTGNIWEQKTGVNWRHDDWGKLRSIVDFQKPVVHVSHHDAVAYCNWLTQKTGKLYRLPTEAEWEFAARGGKESKDFKFAGSNNPKDVAWFWENSERNAHDVALLQPNELGLFDMSGNVWEWCSDWYEKGYYKKCPIDDPQGPQTGSEVVLRGGSWYFFGNQSLLAFRFKIKPELSYLMTGFRVARNHK